ncbi:MAG TPA: DUF3108 domain-containing protein [Pyrinomonadaceae bacterium]|jgi:hypothetical protein
MKRGRSQLLSALALLYSALMFFCVAFAAPAVKRADQPTPLPFEPAEDLVYEGELSKGLLRGIDIADLHFKAERLADNTQVKAGSAGAQPRLRFTAETTTKGLFRKLFGLRFHQHVESIVDPSSFTVLQTRKVDEQGNRKRSSEAIFDQSKGKVVWTERDPNNPAQAPRVVTSDFSGAVQDVASVFYFLRTLPLALGKRVEVTISDSGRVYRIPINVVEKKKMKTVLGQVQTLRLEPELFGEGRLIRGEGKISVWLTDDARRIPVQARISSGMGTLNIKLKKVTNGAAAKPKLY